MRLWVTVVVLLLLAPAVPALHDVPRPYDPDVLPHAGPLQAYPHPVDSHEREGCYPQHAGPGEGGVAGYRTGGDVLPCRNGEGGLGLVPLVPFVDTAYMGDEPDAPEEVVAWHGTYPADANNVADALLGGDPVPVLNAKLGSYCLYDGDWACTYNEYLSLFAGFPSRYAFLVPGLSHATVYSGEWTDLNGDGYVNDADSYPDMFAWYAPHRDLADRSFDEWRNRCAVAMGYLSPHNVGPATTDRDADLQFGNVCGKKLLQTGPFVFLDSSAIETVVTDVYANPVFDPGATRIWQARSGELSDTDVYLAVDTTLEEVYVRDVKPLLAYARDAAGAPGEVAREALEGALLTVAPHLVGARAGFFPLGSTEVTGYDHTASYAPYLDAHLAPWESSCHVFCAVTLTSNGNVTPPASVGTGRESMTPGWVGVVMRFGWWYDSNADGWIGDPQEASACGDMYDCGRTSDPNRYNARDSFEEFKPMCARSMTGSLVPVTVTLTPRTEGQRWTKVPVGADAPNGGGDRGVLGPGTTHFGTGVVVFDDPPGSQDGELILGTGLGVVRTLLWGSPPYLLPDRYHAHTVEEGPIRLTMFCSSAEPGTYYSWQSLLFPTGNIDFDVDLVTSEVSSAASSLGIEYELAVQDADVVEKWMQ